MSKIKAYHRKKTCEYDLPSCPFWGDYNYVPGAIVCKDDISGKQLLMRLPTAHRAVKSAHVQKYCQHMGYEACPNYKELAEPYKEE